MFILNTSVSGKILTIPSSTLKIALIILITQSLLSFSKHPGQSFSVVQIKAFLFFKVVNYADDNMEAPEYLFPQKSRWFSNKEG